MHFRREFASGENVAPSTGQLVAIGLSALFLRIATFLIVILHFHVSFKAYAEAGDGVSYQNYAAAMVGDSSKWTEYDSRVFPGYPALIALLHLATLSAYPVCGLAITWVSASVTAILAAILFQDRRVGWAMVMLIPHWPINSALSMSEAPMLALTMAGLILGEAGWAASAGLLLGMALLTRPVAVFALFGIASARWMRAWRGQALVMTAVAVGVVLAGLCVVKWVTGDALHPLTAYRDMPAAYGGRLFGAPFQSLIETPIKAHVPMARVAYIYAHVLLALAAYVMLIRLMPATRVRQIDFIALWWVAGNTLFTLCIGSGLYGWGFYHFPRFTIPATPAIFYALRRFLPAATWIWICLLVIMGVIAVVGVHGAIVSGPAPRIPGT